MNRRIDGITVLEAAIYAGHDQLPMMLELSNSGALLGETKTKT